MERYVELLRPIGKELRGLDASLHKLIDYNQVMGFAMGEALASINKKNLKDLSKEDLITILEDVKNNLQKGEKTFCLACKVLNKG